MSMRQIASGVVASLLLSCAVTAGTARAQVAPRTAAPKPTAYYDVEVAPSATSPTAPAVSGAPCGTPLPAPTTDGNGWYSARQPYGVRIRADRPKVTQNSAAVPLGQTQTSFGFTYNHTPNENPVVPDNRYRLPEMLVRYGVAENLEVRFGWDGLQWANYQQADPVDLNRGTDAGATNLEIGAKLKLTPQVDFFPETAILGTLGMPSGGAFFSAEDRVEPLGEFLYSWDLHEKVEAGGSFGFGTRTYYEDRQDIAPLSFYLQGEIAPELYGFLEWYALTFASAQLELPQHTLQTGLIWELSPNLQLDWRIGGGLNGQTDRFLTGFGVVFVR